MELEKEREREVLRGWGRLRELWEGMLRAFDGDRDGSGVGDGKGKNVQKGEAFALFFRSAGLMKMILIVVRVCRSWRS
jgi:hypothetical protein